MTENKDIQRLTWKFEDFNLSKVQFCIIKGGVAKRSSTCYNTDPPFRLGRSRLAASA